MYFLPLKQFINLRHSHVKKEYIKNLFWGISASRQREEESQKKVGNSCKRGKLVGIFHLGAPVNIRNCRVKSCGRSRLNIIKRRRRRLLSKLKTCKTILGESVQHIKLPFGFRAIVLDWIWWHIPASKFS